jgi:transcriptional regulator with XRE-family HTH domain
MANLAHALPMPTERGRKIGMRIRSARVGAGLTLDDLGEKLGIKGQTIWRWENGRNTPPADAIPVIAEVCGVPPHDLLAYAPLASTVRRSNPALAEFLRGPEGAGVTDDERIYLITMPPPTGRQPTYLMYHLFLMGIRAGKPPADAAEAAHLTEAATTRANERGWKEPAAHDPKATKTKSGPGPRPRRKH